MLSVLNNEPSPYLDTVLLNAGLALYANGKADSIKACIDIARRKHRIGRSSRASNRLVEFSKSREQKSEVS